MSDTGEFRRLNTSNETVIRRLKRMPNWPLHTVVESDLTELSSIKGRGPKWRGRSDCPFPARPFPPLHSPTYKRTNEDGVVRESLLAVLPVQLSAGTSATVSRVPVASA